MSSSAEAMPAVRRPPRPARWPWVVLAGFLAIAGVAMALVVANDEAVERADPVRRSRSRCSVSSARSSSAATAATRIGHPVPVVLVHHGDVVPVGGAPHLRREQRRVRVVGRGRRVPQQLRMAARDPARRCSCCRCCSRTGISRHLVGGRCCGSSSVCSSLLALHPALRAEDVDRLGRRRRLEPLVHRRDRQSPEPGSGDRARASRRCSPRASCR